MNQASRADTVQPEPLGATRFLRSRLAIRLAFLMCIAIWGTTWAAIRVGLSGVPPFTGAALRFAIAGTLLLALALLRRVPLGRTRREWWMWLVNGTLSFGASYGTVYWAEQWLPSGLASVIFATFPLLRVSFPSSCVAVKKSSSRPGARMSM